MRPISERYHGEVGMVQTGMVDEPDDAARIRAELENLSREPFRRELETLLANPTDPAALKAWANKSPDRRGQLLAILGRLSGYTEKLEVDATVASLSVSVKQMSDMELEQRLAALEAELNALQEPERKSLQAAPRRKRLASGQ